MAFHAVQNKERAVRLFRRIGWINDAEGKIFNWPSKRENKPVSSSFSPITFYACLSKSLRELEGGPY